MIAIREVIDEDAAEIMRLSQQLGYSISVEQTRQNINALLQSKKHKIFVAVHQQEVVGWVGVSYNIQLVSPPLCEINGLIIDEQYRSMGIGKRLIEKAKEWSKSTGINKLRLRCNAKRTEALLFYQNIGFTQMKQQKVFEIMID